MCIRCTAKVRPRTYGLVLLHFVFLLLQIMAGRKKYVPADKSVQMPTAGYDSHVSDVTPMANDDLSVQAKHSQVSCGSIM